MAVWADSSSVRVIDAGSIAQSSCGYLRVTLHRLMWDMAQIKHSDELHTELEFGRQSNEATNYSKE